MRDFYIRETCRLCGSKSLDLALPLKKSPLCDAYLKETKKQIFYDLNLFLCRDCSFVQINTVINPEVIYRDYIYVTTSSTGLSNHFRSYANDVCAKLALPSTSFIIDIGSNEGTLLNYFKTLTHNVLGIEPSIKASTIANNNGIETICDFFNDNLAKNIVTQYGCADLITINNLYANIDDLLELTKGIELLLNKDGILVIESSYLLDMINNMVFDFIYHEHLSYFSILPLVAFFQKFNMHLIALEEVGTKGGSMRYYWAKENSKWDIDERVQELSKKEEDAQISLKTFKKFENSITLAKDKLLCFLEPYRGRKIIGYGASATSTTLITHFELNDYLTYLVDDNVDKINTLSPGFHIPVYSSDKLLTDNVDVLIILAWRYEKEIMAKRLHIPYLTIIPLPELKLLCTN